MPYLPNNQHPIGPPQTPSPMPVPERPRRPWRFRWALWFGVPLGCVLAAYFVHVAGEPTFDWEDVMDVVHVPVRGYERYTRLCVLAMTLLGLVAVLRILKGERR